MQMPSLTSRSTPCTCSCNMKSYEIGLSVTGQRHSVDRSRQLRCCIDLSIYVAVSINGPNKRTFQGNAESPMSANPTSFFILLINGELMIHCLPLSSPFLASICVRLLGNPDHIFTLAIASHVIPNFLQRNNGTASSSDVTMHYACVG